jgi:XTP/dITP diphosphohydrolase
MSTSIIFATNNAHKLEEVKQILSGRFHVLSLAEAGIESEIPEDFETLEENAMQKAEFIFERTGIPSFADDTGLEVEELGGLPGVYSARYAGEAKDPAGNIKKLLHELKGKKNRNARFRCVIAWISKEEKRCFEGIVNGRITEECTGSGGFGYDPVFIPDGYDKTFAALPAEVKNHISHRGKAVRLFSEYLTKLLP